MLEKKAKFMVVLERAFFLSKEIEHEGMRSKGKKKKTKHLERSKLRVESGGVSKTSWVL